MSLEDFFKPEWIAKHTESAIYFGVAYPILGFLTSSLLFRNAPAFIAVATLLFTVILAIPTVDSLLKYEQSVSAGKKTFLKRHQFLINFSLYFFIGVFITFFLLSLVFPSRIFHQGDLYGNAVQSTVRSKLPPPPSVPYDTAIALFNNNAYVLLICFALSLFYGAGSLFLIVLNASIFATTLADVIRSSASAILGFFGNFSVIACNLSIIFLHMVPEAGAYLLAAVAGGVLSKEVAEMNFSSKKFRQSLLDSLLLMLVSFILLLLGVFIEAFVSKGLLSKGICMSPAYSAILIAVLVAVVFIIAAILKSRKLLEKFK